MSLDISLLHCEIQSFIFNVYKCNDFVRNVRFLSPGIAYLLGLFERGLKKNTTDILQFFFRIS